MNVFSVMLRDVELHDFTGFLYLETSNTAAIMHIQTFYFPSVDVCRKFKLLKC